jgi:hypothetical protein
VFAIAKEEKEGDNSKINLQKEGFYLYNAFE